MRPVRQESQERRPALKTEKNSLSEQKALGNEQTTPLLEKKVQQVEAIRIDDICGSISGAIVVDSDLDFEISYDKAVERVAGSTKFDLNHLERSYQQTRGQAQGWFILSLLAAGLVFLLIGAGIVAVMFGQLTAGLITSISSVIPTVASALFFSQSKAANKRVDIIHTRLAEAREISKAVEIVDTIEDPKSRDRLRAEIVRKVLRAEKKPT
jgi:hypothetical protein